jgi:transaldolase
MIFNDEESFKKGIERRFDEEIGMELLKDKVKEVSKKVDLISEELSNLSSKLEEKKKERMKIFIDTADVEEIRKAHSWGILDGVTTNPTLVSKTGRSFKECIDEIVSIVDGPISAEVVSMDAKGMVKEARELAKIHENIVIKIPIIPEGLKAIKVLSKEGIKTNATLCFSANQAILAAKAGATYVSPFIGRLDDIGHEGMQVVRDIVQIFKNYDFDTQVIVASIRHPLHMIEAAKTGAHVATIPFYVLEKMVKHALTDVGIKRFLNDWTKVPKKK